MYKIKQYKMKFQHLEDVNQSYTVHFKDAMKYSWCSFKCSIYFFIHSLYPDVLKTKGSKDIKKLNEIIQFKLSQLNKDSQSD